MRILAKLDDSEKAQKFSSFLLKEGIGNTVEPTFDLQSEKTDFSLWVHDEDDLTRAQELFDQFSINPSDPIYTVQLPPEPEEPASDRPPGDFPVEEETKVKPPSKQGLTFFLVFLCVAIFFYSGLQSYKMKDHSVVVRYTPIQLALLYDVPIVVDLLKNALEREPDGIYTNPETLPPETVAKINKINQTPIWNGFYPLALPKKEGDPNLLSYPTFRLIRQGQVWRTFTPCLLHGDIFHIIFNMIFLWILGRQVERRLSTFRMLFLIIILGILSNTGQYLMSGPFFLGFSGVGLGLAGFIWSRQKIAPWEGHLIHSSVFLFLAFYVLALSFYQILSFVLALTGAATLPPFVIANTAHFVGAVSGIILGRLSFFSWRPKK